MTIEFKPIKIWTLNSKYQFTNILVQKAIIFSQTYECTTGWHAIQFWDITAPTKMIFFLNAKFRNQVGVIVNNTYSRIYIRNIAQFSCVENWFAVTVFWNSNKSESAILTSRYDQRKMLFHVSIWNIRISYPRDHKVL